MPGRPGRDERGSQVSTAATMMLVAYHPGTGTSISLSDPVYLIDYMEVTEDMRSRIDDGAVSEAEARLYGVRLTNWNASEFYHDEVRKARGNRSSGSAR